MFQISCADQYFNRAYNRFPNELTFIIWNVRDQPGHHVPRQSAWTSNYNDRHSFTIAKNWPILTRYYNPNNVLGEYEKAGDTFCIIESKLQPKRQKVDCLLTHNCNASTKTITLRDYSCSSPPPMIVTCDVVGYRSAARWTAKEMDVSKRKVSSAFGWWYTFLGQQSDLHLPFFFDNITRKRVIFKGN